MKVITADSVPSAYYQGLRYLLNEGVEEQSRNGSVLVSPVPVTTVYTKPLNRVLFSAARNANPFFHLLEAMWMLAGRDDAAFLNNYVKDFGSRFAETDGRIHGAYGYRWRKGLGFDQLDEIVGVLRDNSNDRQCVLQIWDGREARWDGESFTEEGFSDLTGVWKDCPCNTQIFFRIRDNSLDVMVSCRSNDIVWGAYGANCVHMTFLQEYMAGRIGVPVGTYYQVSWNYHGYHASLDKIKAIELDDRYNSGPCLAPSPLVTHPDIFDEELYRLMEAIDLVHRGEIPQTMIPPMRNSFLDQTVYRAAVAHAHYRTESLDYALKTAELIESPDWRAACCEWLRRRNGVAVTGVRNG